MLQSIYCSPSRKNAAGRGSQKLVGTSLAAIAVAAMAAIAVLCQVFFPCSAMEQSLLLSSSAFHFSVAAWSGDPHFDSFWRIDLGSSWGGHRGKGELVPEIASSWSPLSEPKFRDVSQQISADTLEEIIRFRWKVVFSTQRVLVSVAKTALTHTMTSTKSSKIC